MSNASFVRNQAPRKSRAEGIAEAVRNFSVSDFSEAVINLPLSALHPPEFHPFGVREDEAMRRLVKSIAQYGVREPGLARPRVEGGYEVIAGNRRHHACLQAGLSSMPFLVREMDDDAASIAMVDSNLEQREALLFSERAWAYRVKLEALNHSGVRGDALSVEVLVAQTGESKNQIYRLVRLTELVPDLLDLVDVKKLAFNPAVELSYLSRTEQAAVVAAMERHEVKPSLSQAQRLKRLKQDGKLTASAIDKLLAEEKKPPKSAGAAQFRRFFPAHYTERQMEEVIAGLLREWQTATFPKTA